MKNKTAVLLKSVALLMVSAGLLIIASCNSTPTVPVPPPEMTLITVSHPDADGWVNLDGSAHCVPAESVVLVFNDNTGDVEGDEADDQGAFNVRIKAQEGHILVIQVKIGINLSNEEEITVN